MHIRPYRPGDERAQAEIYNEAAGRLPAFKPASPDEIGRRYRTSDPGPAARLFAVEGDRVVGYATSGPQGRVSYPWCLAGAEAARTALLEGVVSALAARGADLAWAAYRADWAPVLDFFGEQGFARAREMVNYAAEVADLPRSPVPEGRIMTPLGRSDLPRVLELGGDLFRGEDLALLEAFLWHNQHLDPGWAYALRGPGGELLGAALAVIRADYADPTKVDPAMPCFRLGALGTERERHKRINGLFSCVFADELDGEALLAEAARRMAAAGVSHAAAQVPSDQPRLGTFYDRHFRRQATFPILAKPLPTPG